MFVGRYSGGRPNPFSLYRTFVRRLTAICDDKACGSRVVSNAFRKRSTTKPEDQQFSVSGKTGEMA